MKRHPIPISVLLFITLACRLFSTGTPEPAPAISPPAAASPMPLPTPSSPLSPSPSALADDAATALPEVTIPAAVTSPQPAVAHHRPGDPITLDKIVMIDKLNGWAFSAGEVLFTADGAQTWREATPPQAIMAGSQVQAQGAFLDAQHAWVVFSFDKQILPPPEAVVWHTSDSGHTWLASQPLDYQISGQEVWAEFFALDATSVWLIVRGVYAGAGTHYVGQLFHSTDGGLTWQPLIGDGSFDYNYDYTSLLFADADHGLLTWETMGAYAPGPPEYAVTSDGAASWELHQLPPPPDQPKLFETFDYCEPFQAHMFSARSIRVVAGCLSGADTSRAFHSYLYSSEDGGSTWTSVPLPAAVRTVGETLFFFENGNLLLLDRDIYRSTDGGQSWDFIKTLSWDGQFTFVDPQNGWAIARANDQAALVKTSNGGKTWVEIKPVIAR